MTAIILINWNGAKDTLACLESLNRVQGEFVVIVVDNHSTDNSLQLIQQWKDGHLSFPLHIVEEKENHGFARGNNIGIQFASQFHPKYYLLLNNDTEVEPDFLQNLTEFHALHPQYKVLTPQINYYYDKSIVWLCGGNLKFGSRSKLYQDRLSSEITEQDYIPVTFVSGCALWCTSDLLLPNGELLTNRFFFGEEDYDFALRMQQAGVQMACVLSSRIYHKVGASRSRIKDDRNVGKDYCFYLGKLICCRLYYRPVKFAFLMALMLPKAFLLFKRTTGNWNHALSITCQLMKEAYHKQGISREVFQHYVNNTFI